MSTLVFYVIRHLPSDTLLPARVLATHYEFDRPAGTHEPRLFKSKRAAMNCATCWAQGVWVRDMKTETHGWELAHLDFDYKAEPVPTPAPGRRREDLVVESVQLVFHSGRNVSAEQKARDMLERAGVSDAQSRTAGELVELANLIAGVSS